jgi:beta-glucosidase
MRRRHALPLLLLALLAAAWAVGMQVGAGRGASLVTSDEGDAHSGPLRFPPGFLWGVAMSGQQAESQQPSDWTAFEEDAFRNGRFEAGRPGHIQHLGQWSAAVRREKAGFETHYREDLARAREMGLNVFRFSIEWARLFPRAGMDAPDPAGVAYYKALLAEMKAQGLLPFATLFHYAAPAWFFEPDASGARGWERADAQALWRRYVEAVAANFIPDITHWCTLNEPMVYVYNGWMEGTYPPLQRRPGVRQAAPVIRALLQAHAAAYAVLHRAARQRGVAAEVGIAENTLAFEPLRNWAPLDRLSAQAVAQAWNWDFLDAIASGRMTLTDTDLDEPLAGLAGTQDYVGINYYSRTFIKSDLFHPGAPQVLMHDPDARDEPVNDLGWASYPHGFYLVLTEAAKRYRRPIHVLENGTADAAGNDVARQRFLRQHVREAWLARERGGADVRSYLHWSLTDNFEWADGFDARFGLVAVDYGNGLRRTPRPSAALYSAIAHANGLPAALRNP